MKHCWQVIASRRIVTHASTSVSRVFRGYVRLSGVTSTDRNFRRRERPIGIIGLTARHGGSRPPAWLAVTALVADRTPLCLSPNAHRWRTPTQVCSLRLPAEDTPTRLRPKPNYRNFSATDAPLTQGGLTRISPSFYNSRAGGIDSLRSANERMHRLILRRALVPTPQSQAPPGLPRGRPTGRGSARSG